MDAILDKEAGTLTKLRTVKGRSTSFLALTVMGVEAQALLSSA